MAGSRGGSLAPRDRANAAGRRHRVGVHACVASAVQEVSPRRAGDALLVDLDPAPSGPLGLALATGNVFPAARHGTLGDAAASRQRFDVPHAPVAADVDPAGQPHSSLAVRVDGVRWDERPTLYDSGPANVYTTRLAADVPSRSRSATAATARPATGRNNVTAEYRVGGGTEGEVEDGAIDALLGSVRGVRKVQEQVRPRAEPIRRTSGGSAPRAGAHARSVVSSRARTPRI